VRPALGGLENMGEGEVMTLLEELTTEATNRDQERGWARETVAEITELRNPELLAPFKRAYLSDKSLTIRDTKNRKVVDAEVSNGEMARLYLRRIMKEDTDLLSKRVPY